jgi:hypothetical protein
VRFAPVFPISSFFEDCEQKEILKEAQDQSFELGEPNSPKTMFLPWNLLTFSTSFYFNTGMQTVVLSFSSCCTVAFGSS